MMLAAAKQLAILACHPTGSIIKIRFILPCQADKKINYR